MFFYKIVTFLQITLRIYETEKKKEIVRFNNFKDNECYNENANTLIKKIKGDILYLDPPYNSRQYLPNYHLLETVAKYDNPKIKGKTGIREYKSEKSDLVQFDIDEIIGNEFATDELLNHI